MQRVSFCAEQNSLTLTSPHHYYTATLSKLILILIHEIPKLIMPRLKAKPLLQEIAKLEAEERIECPPSPMLKNDVEQFESFEDSAATPPLSRQRSQEISNGSESERKKGKKPATTSATATQRSGARIRKSHRRDELEEEMSDDPTIQQYAETYGQLQWGTASTLSDVPAFKAFPKPTRDQRQLIKNVEEWGKDSWKAGMIMPDSSGMNEQKLRELEQSVKPYAKRKAAMQLDVDEDGGWIERGPRGGEFWASEEGQDEGGELLRQDEDRKATEGELRLISSSMIDPAAGAAR